jgi:hypothetical protein
LNRELLAQARKGIQKLIDENKTTIIIYRKSLIDDGFGGEVEDPSDEGTPITIRCRISHEKEGPEKLNSAPPGLSTNLSRFIMVNYKTLIFENESFEDDTIEKSFKIGPVDPLRKFGGTTAYQAPLIEAVKVEQES